MRFKNWKIVQNWGVVAFVIVLVLPFALLDLSCYYINKLTSPNSYSLSSGQAVKLVEDHDAQALSDDGPKSRNDYYLQTLNYQKVGEVITQYHLKTGTLAVVTCDTGDDDDSAGRMVAVRLVGGEHDGSVVMVSRGSIRER